MSVRVTNITGPLWHLARHKQLLLICTFVWLGSLAFLDEVAAQQRMEFSNSYELFVKELTEQMEASKRDDYKKLMADFTQSWGSEYIDAQKDVIIRAANDMKRKRLPIYPYFGNYLELLQQIKAVDVSAKRFYEWHGIYTKVMTLNQRSVDQFVRSSIDFYGKNAIYLSNAIRWDAGLAEYSFVFESNQVKVVFPQLSLRCDYFNDSIVIRNTRGFWLPVEQRFEGIGGRIDWQRAAFPQDSIYADLRTYAINLKQFQLDADSVKLFNKGLNRFIPGVLQEKCTANPNPEQVNFPRFTSYEGELNLKNIFKNVSVRGKYALYGNRYMAVGTKREPAEVFIYKNDTTTVRALSQQFAIRKTEIYATNAEVTVVLRKDSIYHPGISMRFTTADRKLLLFLEPGAINKVPFSNSYHQLDTYCEALSWKIDDPIMEFKMQTGLSEAIAVFTSKDYFDQREYLAAQGYATYNPLVRLFQYGRQVGENFFSADGFAAFMKLPLNSVRTLLIDLANQGFIYYDRELEEITLLKKLYHYNSASAGRIDFDIIKFVSKTSQESNAVLNIATRELQVNGVNVVILSDTHTVFAVPSERKMLVTKNRGMEFSGHVHSGTLDFYGDGFTFNYDSFMVRMQNVDSMRFQVLTGRYDVRGQPVLAQIQNALENITGTLYIDDPANKSARKPLYQYPYFISKQESFVYYDKPEIQQGAYKRDGFYFKVDPFVLDSLDFAGSTSRLQLNGVLVSNIFPEIREKLRFQDDLSLGFSTRTPESGYPVYGGKGKYFSNITLDRQGLHGYGRLEYLSSVSRSNNYFFLPDKTTSQLEVFDIAKGPYKATSYPQVNGKDIGMVWLARADSMQLYKGPAPFDMYEGLILFDGNLLYTPVNLFGDGVMLYGRDKVLSRQFVMEQQKTRSEQLSLEIASNTPNLLALKTDELSGEIDFAIRYGKFQNKLGFTKVDLPYNEYEARLEKLEWDLRKNALVLGSKDDLQSPKTTFSSVHPGQDRLRFIGAYAAMDLQVFDLDIHGIPEIRSADAIIVPDSGRAVVSKEARMIPLKNAVMLFDSVQQVHRVYNASVDILGRKKFEAEGVYDYINSDQKRQAIFLNILRPNIRGITVGSGTISPDSNFMLNPGFGYSGSVSLSSEQKALTFNGVVRLTQLADTLSHVPFRYNSAFEPSMSHLEVPEFKDEQNKRTFAGLMLNLASNRIYAAIGGPKVAGIDSILMETAGIVKYDAAADVYEIGPSDAVLNNGIAGNKLVVKNKNAVVVGSGKIRLGFDKEPIRFATAGEITHRYLEGKTDMLLSALIDVLVPDDALKIFYNQLVDYSFGAQDVNNDQEYVKVAFANLSEGKDRDRLIKALEEEGVVARTDATDHLFVISNLDLSWDGDTRSFRSKEAVGIANMNGEVINKRLNGIFEIQILPTGRTFNLLVEPSQETYFFFNYRSGRIYPVATLMEFNESIKKGLGKKKKKGIENKVSMGITQNRDRLVSRHENWLKQ